RTGTNFSAVTFWLVLMSKHFSLLRLTMSALPPSKVNSYEIQLPVTDTQHEVCQHNIFADDYYTGCFEILLNYSQGAINVPFSSRHLPVRCCCAHRQHHLPCCCSGTRFQWHR